MKRLAMMIAAVALGAGTTDGCVARPAAPAPGQQPDNSILAASRPVAGSTVQAPVDALELHFHPPARLDEATISGPEGVMPTMVHSVGEIASYSIPLPDLGAGSYAVSWRATSGGREYRGKFQFKVHR